MCACGLWFGCSGFLLNARLLVFVHLLTQPSTACVLHTLASRDIFLLHKSPPRISKTLGLLDHVAVGEDRWCRALCSSTTGSCGHNQYTDNESDLAQLSVCARSLYASCKQLMLHSARGQNQYSNVLEQGREGLTFSLHHCY